MKNIKIGADPELFLEKDGKLVSAEGVIGGSKENPRAISKDGHAVQEDNVMVEFNIPACKEKEDFIFHINFVKSYLETLADMKGYSLNYSASGDLSPEELCTDQAMEFGCDPDWDVYSRFENVPPEPVGTMRCCGGHIHVGYDNPDEDTTIQIAYAMDMILGLESLSKDTDTRRRVMYGKAGSFRFKPYGMEYRTLSNFWIKDDELISWAFDKTMEAIELVKSGEIDKLVDEYSELVKTAINTNDKQLAQVLLDKIRQKELQITI